MSSIVNKRSISRLSIGLATGLLALGVASAGASNRGLADDPTSWLHGAETLPPGAGSTTQSSASAWTQSNGDHGMTITTTRSGDITSCMVVEWRRENGDLRQWQYRCDTAQP
ncbi:hypothetical protein OSH10_22030 [Kaistia defluvii]|uniref:hypothetical protein n=1 Tax=Kaistia defluvii TaxID=410841 RepID=UPI002258E647|nr:hypothetical protein [Kaistia defluvii]MCX5521126.1 hypothetical protein [Kaistia defluvii]